MEKVREMFKEVPVARIEGLLKSHDVHTAIDILLGEVEKPRSVHMSKSDDDSDDLPVIDLTVSDLQ